MNALLFCICLSGFYFSRIQLEKASLQEEKIHYRTISIFNDQYFTANNWGAIPVDKLGEDVNSLRFGGVYYPPSIRDLNRKESRTTVAQGSMEIEVDLLNTTADTYQLESITLTVTGVYESSGLKGEAGEWEIGSRTSSYRPHFEILEGRKVIIQPIEEITIWPEEEYMDSRFIFEIFAKDSASRGKIYAFVFTLNFTKQEGQETLVINSDKTYFIAASHE